MQHVADAGNEQGIVEVRCNGVAPAVNQHRRNRTAIPGKHGANACVDRIAHALHECVGLLQRPLGVR